MDNRVYIHHPPHRERTRLRLMLAGAAVLCLGIAALQIRLTFASNSLEEFKNNVITAKEQVREGAATLAPEGAVEKVEDALADVNAAIEAQQALEAVVTDVNADIAAEAQPEAEAETPTTP